MHALLFPPFGLGITDSAAACIDDSFLTRFGITHLQQANIGQLCYAFVVNLNGNYIMLMGSNGERLQEGMPVDKVAQHKSDATALDGTRQILQGECDVRLLTFGLVVEKFADDVENVLATFLGRNELLNLD